MQIQASGKRNLTEREAFERYGVGIVQLRKMRARNSGPRYIKISGQIGQRGGRVLYPVEDLERWLNSVPTGGGRAA